MKKIQNITDLVILAALFYTMGYLVLTTLIFLGKNSIVVALN